MAAASVAHELQQLQQTGSLVVECVGLVPKTSEQTCVSCIDRQILLFLSTV